ncbi:MAG: ABC transporter ATP-binding protein, partial [Gemmatimonadota bacterium]|nr:ABC transporter ATP-binding protein [Gemmatimonadota bacterium]
MWALGAVWGLAPRLLAGFAAVAVLRGVLPACLALVLRGLVNAAVQVTGSQGSDVTPLLPWLAMGLGLSLANAVILLSSDYLRKRLKDELQLGVTTRILEHASTLDLSFFENPRDQDLLERTRNEVPYRMAWLISEIEELATSVVRGVSLAAILVAIEPLVLVVVPPFVIPFLFFQWRLARQRHAEEKGRTKERRWTDYYMEQLTGVYSMAEVRLLNLGPVLLESFRSLMAGFRDRDRRLHLKNFQGSALTAGLTVAALYLVFVRVAFRAVEGAVTLGDLAIFGGASSHLRQAFDRAIRAVAVVFEQTLFIADLRTFLDLRPRLSQPDAGVARPASGARTPAIRPGPRGEIRVENVTFAYPGSTDPVLRDLSLHVRPGERVAIVGQNGAGKSTLVKLVLRLYDPDRGRILFDGVDLREIPPAEHHRRVAFVLQAFGEYETTAARNIAYGDRDRLLPDGEVDLRAVERVASAARIEPLIRSLPGGYDTLLGRMFGHHTLSGGQWQRFALGRALARDADLLVLDEPTSNLDAGAESKLMRVLEEHARG